MSFATAPTNSTDVYEMTTTQDTDSEYTTAMIYGYGTASVVIISLFSLFGILLFPTLGSRSAKLVLQFFIGLGIGTMTADALLHIIPVVLGIHGHETEVEEEEAHDDHEHEEIENETLYVWKMSVVFGGIYLFFCFENGLKTWKRCRGAVNNGEIPIQDIRASNTSLATRTSEISKKETSITSFSEPSAGRGVEVTEGNLEEFVEEGGKDIVCFSFTTTLLTVFIGDVLHNMADGLAIGVSFALSWTAGVGTSLAIVFHEIPHEFGDFAIYLTNGASKWGACLLNLAAACCAFIGLYIGIALGDDENVQPWLLGVVAGMFLYIALVQVAGPTLQEESSMPVLLFLVQNLGWLLGWAIMLLMALYEEDIEASITG